MKLFGWISPKKQFFPCKDYEHAKCAFENFSEVNEMFSGIFDDLAYTQEQCQQMSDEGEHPEWHRYEIALSDFDCNLVEFMYRRGYIRVGTIYNNNTCCFEGVPEILRQHNQFCLDLCEKNGLTPKFEPRKI